MIIKPKRSGILNLNGKIEYYLSMIKCSRKEIIAPAVCLCCFLRHFVPFEGLKAEYSRAKVHYFMNEKNNTVKNSTQKRFFRKKQNKNEIPLAQASKELDRVKSQRASGSVKKNASAEK